MDREIQVYTLGEDGKISQWLNDIPPGPHLDRQLHLGAAVTPHTMDVLVSSSQEPHAQRAPGPEEDFPLPFMEPSFQDLDSKCFLYLAELTREIDTHFAEIGHVVQEVQVQMQLLGDVLVGDDTFSARATGKFPIKENDTKEIAKLVHEKIFELETKKLAEEKSTKIFQPEETENLHGELEKDLEKYKDQPRLYQLLCKYKDIFGLLPPPQNACPLVQMDIQLKEEWVGKPLRQKCWPLPVVDQNEIEQQAEELLKAGLIEAFPPGEIPLVCSPTFLVDKKESKTRRMVIQFRKLNSRSKSHAGYLPNMEQLVESLAKCRFKTKLDMRSGFWQVGLSERAKNLCAFCIPSGRCFRPLCMMFGLQGAPGIFQELMEILATKCKQYKDVRDILVSGHLASFFDDTGLGSQTLDEHFVRLEHYFQVCAENNIRIKLSKCEFLKEEIDYLGFSIGWGKWQPSKSKSAGHSDV